LITFIAALSSFLLTAITAWSGVALTHDPQNPLALLGNLCIAISISSLVQAIAFGRQSFRVQVVATILALAMLWLPQLMYATSTSAAQSAAGLLLLIVVAICALRAGGRLRNAFRSKHVNNAVEEGAWRVGHRGRDSMYYEEYRAVFASGNSDRVVPISHATKPALHWIDVE